VAAGKDRHVLMYTTDATDEAIIHSLGFDGALPSPTSGFAQLTVQNFGGNKLDYYLHSSVRLTGAALSPLGNHVTATIDLSNATPMGQTSPVEVFGPFRPGGQAGEYVGLVTLYLPAGSNLSGSRTDGSVTTGPTPGSQNSIATISFTVAMPPGTGSHVVLNLYVPPTPARAGRFVFVPAPRVIATTYLQDLH
jgi:hypothetical protein